MSTLGVVFIILHEQSRPMRVGEIMKAANGRLSAVTSAKRPRSVVKTELSRAIQRGDRRFVCVAPGLFGLGAAGNEALTVDEPPGIVGEEPLSLSAVPGAERTLKRRRGMGSKGGNPSGVPFAPQPRMLKLVEIIQHGYEWLHKPLWGPTAAQGAPVPPLTVGAQFGFWTVLEAPNPPRQQAKWKCRCMCGVVRAVTGSNLLTSASRSCKCSKFSWTADAKKKLRATWVENRRASGLCLFCDNHAIDNRSRCSDCLSKTIKRAKTRYNERVANKQCPFCGKEPVADRKFCQECLYKETASTFNLSVEEVARLRKLPCEVCGESARTVLDHNHVTGATRGVLCNGCNAALGFVKEDPITLQRLIAYIYRYQVVASTEESL